MRVHLNESEIFEAIRQYIEVTGISLGGKDIEIHFTAGRKSGPRAQVEITTTRQPETDDKDTIKSVPNDSSAPAILFDTTEEED